MAETMVPKLRVDIFSVRLVAVVLGLVAPSGAWLDTTGFDLLFQSNEAILRNLPVSFDSSLPPWINGTMIHNGPGKFEVNGRKFGHLFDGFAKPLMWKFDGFGHVKFTTDFLKTNFYIESMQMRDVAPYLLYMPPSPGFSWFTRMRQISNGLDNVNVNVARIKGEYMYLSDIWKHYGAKPPGEWSVRSMEPSVPFPLEFLRKFALSSSHPLPVDHKDSEGPLLNYYAIPMFGGHTIHLCKVISPTKVDFFAEVSLGPLPYMHSFGATEKFMILFGHPLYVDPYTMIRTQAAVKAMLWRPEDGTTVYVVNKESGKVQTFKTISVVMTHHVNAYETSSGKIVADFVTFPDPSPFTMFTMKIITNSTARNIIGLGNGRIRRFVFDLKRNSIDQIMTPNFNSLANRLELPVINENFRYQHYCYVYGVSMHSDEKNFADFRLTKRDMCLGKDLWWGKPGFYPSEPWFVPRPGATQEDDGLLFSTILDGKRKVSYLGVFDGHTLKQISKSYLPTYVPFLLHGKFFPST